MGYPTRKTVPPPNEPASILLASPYPEDHLFLSAALAQPQWKWHAAESFRSALKVLRDHPVAVAICERELPDGSWRDLLEAGMALPAPPSVIVCSRLADESLWAEVLNLGGYDVLVKPFDGHEVARVASSAWRAWSGGSEMTSSATASF